MIAINKKSGDRYVILQKDIKNATNGNEEQYMVLYVREDQAHEDDPQLYIRERNEFYHKFIIL